MDSTPMVITSANRRTSLGMIGLVVLPLLLLAGLVGLLVATGSGLRPSGAPPVEELTVQRIVLPRPGEMVVQVANGGPSPVTIAQVAVDDAFWSFDIEPGPTIPRLGAATVRVPYPWVEAEPHEVALVTSTGLTFSGSVEVALVQPQRDLDTLLRFLLLGFYVGVVPVALGMLWFPAVKRMGTRGLVFVLSLTIGLLVFLLIDTFLEALEVAGRLPAGLHGVPLVWLVSLLTIGAIEAIGSVGRANRTPLGIAGLIALGIGLHNFGEGLAIGAAYTLGELALGAFLVIGFTLHNITEGLAIATPLTRGSPRLRNFVGLAILAGAPAMLGTWVGAFSYSDLGAVLFLAIGAGAIAQVVYAVSRFTGRIAGRDGAPALSPVSVGGFAAGIAIMYLTALFVAA
jgi:zinc transporter ZupT